jgi:hypothetical protein
MWPAARSGCFTSEERPVYGCKNSAGFFLHFLFMVQLCNEVKGILGVIFNPVPISSSFASVSTYLLCVLLLSNMKHVDPLLPMCKLFCSMEKEYPKNFV